MKKKNLATITFAGLAALGLAVGTASAAMADVQPNGSDAGVYLFNNDAGAFVADGSTLTWTDDTSLSPTTDDPYGPLQCPADSTGFRTFIATPGQERTQTGWKAWASYPFADGTKTVKGADVQPSFQLQGSNAPVKSAGGNYSLGMACTKDNYVNFASSGVWFVSAHFLTDGSGSYTFDPVVNSGPTTPPSGTGSIDIQATTVAAEDGVLSLVVPASAKATLGTATLVNQLSTSTGALPAFQVSDHRVVTAPGWDLTASTVNFVNAADSSATIDSKQLGVKPKVVGNNPAGVVLGTEHLAGDAAAFSAFASAPSGAGIGDTSLSADLTLVAPASTPAGTYNSTMTLTLVSK